MRRSNIYDHISIYYSGVHPLCPFVFKDGALIQYKYLNRVFFGCKTKLGLIVPGRHGKYIFAQESFYLQCILNSINEQDTSFILAVNTSTW